MAKLRTLALLTALWPVGPALAQDGPAGKAHLDPATQCAAFWAGFASYRATGADTATTRWARRLSGAFREVAIRLNGGDSAAVDAALARELPNMERLNLAVHYYHDRSSRDIFDRMALTCERFGQGQPETRGLL